MRRRWPLVAVLLVVLVVSLGAGERPKRERYKNLNRLAPRVADEVKRNQLQRRRGETLSNELTVVTRAGSRAKDKPLQEGRRTRSKQPTHKKGKTRSRPAGGKKRRKGAGQRRRASGKEMCLSKALLRCGKKIRKLKSMKIFAKRCQAKEKFLDCMSRSQRRLRRCAKRKRPRRVVIRRIIKRRQRRLQRQLIHARGCVIGVDLSATTPLTNR